VPTSLAQLIGRLTYVLAVTSSGAARVTLPTVTTGGFEVAFHGEYREIVPNERLAFTEAYEAPEAQALPDAEAPLNIGTVTEVDGRTTLTHLTQTTSKALRDTIIDSRMEGGMQEGMDLLEEVAISLR
jgi:uncharacterized protein YndB with AHSA1/START domain